MGKPSGIESFSKVNLSCGITGGSGQPSIEHWATSSSLLAVINTESSCSSGYFSLQSEKLSRQQHSRSDQYCFPTAESKTTSHTFIKTCCYLYRHPAWIGVHIWKIIQTVQYYKLIEKKLHFLFTLYLQC